MPRILVFKHVAAEPLGRLDPLIRARGHRIRYVNFERHPEAQPSMDRYRGLIVLGGPMNVEQQDRFPHLRVEMAVIEQALAQGKPVLGICLGAQLLAHALGAAVRRLEQPEIGWYPLQPTSAAKGDPVLAPLPDPQPIFQWHGCTFALPDGATHLAATSTCHHQAFRYGDEEAWGFQFHMEMDLALIRRWLSIPAYQRELADAGLAWGRDEILADSVRHLQSMNGVARDVFNRFLDRIGRPQRRVMLPSR